MLYRSDALNKGVEKHIADYLVEFCGMTEEEADKGRYDLYKGHGLTVGGLVAKDTTSTLTIGTATCTASATTAASSSTTRHWLRFWTASQSPSTYSRTRT